MTDVFTQMESDVRFYSKQFPVVFSKASGSYMFSSSGRRYLDFLSGAGSLNYGHNNKYIMDAVIEYLRADNIIHSLDLMTEAKELFLSNFRDYILLPRALPYKCQFTGPTGANAVEAALKLARKVTQRSGVLAFSNAYHGLSLGALSVTANKQKRAAAGTSLNGSIFMPYDGFLGAEVDTTAYLERMLNDPGSGIDPPAAIIVETIQGEGGLNVASQSWLRALSASAGRHGAMLIVDDIQAGCGRTGAFFSFEEAGIVPDIVVLSKSLSGFGSPFSLVLMREDIDIWKPGEHNGTFRGNNLAFVGGAKALSHYWVNENFISEVRQKSEAFKDALTNLCKSFPELISAVNGRGMMLGCEFVEPGMATKISGLMFDRDIIIETCGPGDKVLKFLPPLTVTIDEMNESLGIFREILKTISGRSDTTGPGAIQLGPRTAINNFHPV
ncbi:diaminobutyrate--2-oxoglutarate transaminase (plasmid) [Agrobacterium vitis]|uniref:diaminobutyrate--2-oxoglutarate transaminase n=1 Tax=Agrobacterium vitis TaxID=373 RepID=UPI0015DA46AC|nr:diaminobutyrate--2-oxoglutarate transaminase [Agrobacterium vitis]BCH67481.1 diaminobutyrate--2-oxoglutarate transaminase [Agrobacterium vitis]